MKETQHLFDGWKTRAICEFIGITRVTLRYWSDKVHPKKIVTTFTSYDVLIYMIIKTYVNEHRLQLSRLRKIDWDGVADDLDRINFSELTTKILNVNLKDNTYGIYDSIDDFSHTKIYNHSVELKNHSLSIINRLEKFSISN